MKPHVRTALAAAFLAAVTLGAAAQDAPGLAGRISLVEGQVNLGGLAEPGPAMMNFPVTSGMELTTERDARTEVRVGSTAVRLDGDSSLEVSQLDDDHFRLRLYYGSVSVRVRDRMVAADFSLETPQGQIRLTEPGQIRIDAEREPDTTALNVFDGTAVLDGYGNSVTVHAGRRAELRGDDVRTSYAVRDSFDDWSELRDRRDERVVAIRYIPADMTGYEDLDAHGYWRDSAEYGVLWFPRTVPAGWAPYRDGSWVWLNPWGWTWVDRAPWGYAPFHYGRWVLLNGRWCWAPGSYRRTRPVWAPALVGWVGGANWQLSFTHDHDRRPLPAQGWYPLSPRDHWVPSYRARPEHVRIITGQEQGPDRRRHDFRPQGVTVVPQHEFTRGGRIDVPHAPKAGVTPGGLTAAMAAAAAAATQPAPPPPPAAREPHRRQPGPATVIPYRPGVVPDRDRDEPGRRPASAPVQPQPAPVRPPYAPQPQPAQPANVRPPYAPPQQPAQPGGLRPPFVAPGGQPATVRPPFAPPRPAEPARPLAPQPQPAAPSTARPPFAQPPGHDAHPVPAGPGAQPAPEHRPRPAAASPGAYKRLERQDDGGDEARPERRLPPRPLAAPSPAVPMPHPAAPAPAPIAAPHPQQQARPAEQKPAHGAPFARKKDELRDGAER